MQLSSPPWGGTHTWNMKMMVILVLTGTHWHWDWEVWQQSFYVKIS
jgi:hypothetical protein